MAIRPYAASIATRHTTPQTLPIPGREKDMTKNSAGGYSFKVDDWTRLNRFLILGSEGGTYYASEQKLTKDNASAVLRCIKADGPRTVRTIIEVSDAGRAPKNDPAIFALGLCMKEGNEETKKLARAAVPQVCRIGTHLFHLAEVIKNIGGWGRGTKNAFAQFYMNEDRLGEQLVKYQSRDGWSHKDILRKIHIKPKNHHQRLAFKWAVGKAEESDLKLKNMPEMIIGFEKAKKAEKPKEIVKLIEEYNLPREAIPTQFLNDLDVWEALLLSGKGMPMTAMIRNLGKMTSIGLLKPLSKATKFVVDRLESVEHLHKARIHPLNLLIALRTYGNGHGEKGSLTWTTNHQIVSALDTAFYESFKHVEPTGKNFLLGLDISGSMGSAASGTILRCCEVTAAMAMLAMRTEKNSYAMGFSDRFVDLGITAKDSLNDALKKVTDRNFGSTDCAMPMEYAIKEKLDVDMFVVYTDNETYAGRRQPVQSLQDYRKKFDRPAKLMVVGLTASNVSIADPNDSGMLDVAGFDAALPQIMADFAKQ